MSKFAHDQQLIKEKALPAAGATAYTDAIDLGGNAPGLAARNVDFEFGAEIVPSLADTKLNTLTLQDSADGTTFTDLAAHATLVQTGASGTGAAAVSRAIVLSGAVRRYVRVKSVITAVGGDNTAKKFYLKAKF